MMEIVKDEQPQAMVLPEFDPNKKYRWTPDTKFILEGAEFATLLNSMRAILSTEEAQTILAAQRASDELEKLLKDAVEDGRAVEIQ
jgi:hypothetical protein